MRGFIYKPFGLPPFLLAPRGVPSEKGKKESLGELKESLYSMLMYVVFIR